MRKHLPNFLTLLNLFCGCIAVVFAVMNSLDLAAIFVFFGILFDFLDGFAARMLKVTSDIGVQLDSLADMVTSGLVPGIVMFQLLSMAQKNGWNLDLFGMHTEVGLLPLFGFLITLASAYRLANFNHICSCMPLMPRVFLLVHTWILYRRRKERKKTMMSSLVA